MAAAAPTGAMEVDEEEVETPSSSTSKGDKKRFEVKKVPPPKFLIYFNLIVSWCL